VNEIFRAAVERKASDIHIKAGDVVRARIHGRLLPLTRDPVTPEQVRALALTLIPFERDRARIDELTDYDGSWGAPELGRFRVNILRQRGTLMVVLRVIPFEVPTLEALRLPPVLATLAESAHGLILVTGATGSGKSSTLAAMVRHINETAERHIVTLENPIEFLHRDRRASITQRDIGSDTPSFSSGLRSILRQDPDVILVGEMRDAETIDTALRAAETGHLVLSTLHTRNAIQTLSRILAVFPASEQAVIRVRLAEALRAVVSQRLLPRKEEDGRVVACEVMVVTGTVRDCILNPHRNDEIIELVEEGRSTYGSQSFDQHLLDLLREGEITFDVARSVASNPADLDLKVNLFGGGTFS
jgi:twitching motility protein PilT